MAVSTVIVAVFIFAVMALVFAPIMTWVERKQSALMQDRIGANRANILGVRAIGLLHPLADAVKMFTKEDTIPAGSNRLLHLLCPFIATVPALVSFAVIPYGGSYSAWGAEWQLVVADLDYGVLYLFAVGSVATYGSMLAGWAGNNNWGMLGSLRVSAQMLSYEVAMGISIVGVFMIFGTLRLTDMGYAQQQLFQVFGFLVHFGWVEQVPAALAWIKLPMWGILLQPASFFIFLAAILAENKRPPFDTPEGESEIVAGYFIEYSGMKFGLYTMGELLEVVVIGGLVTALFLGGWSIPYVSDGALIAFFTKAFGPNLGQRDGDDRPRPGVLHQGDHPDLLSDVDSLEHAALPLRPGDGPGLEDPVAALDHQRGGHRRGGPLDPGPDGLMEQILFYSFGGLAVASALGVVLNVKNTVNSALSLVVSMLSLAVLFIMLQAEFIGVLQVMVYAGAIVVLFLFVVMLLNLQTADMGIDRQRGLKLLGIGVAAVVTIKLGVVLRAATRQWAEVPDTFGQVKDLATVLFTDYLLAFEVAGVLLLAGLVGAVILAKKTID